MKGAVRSMKCPVCGKVYSDQKCPVCTFPIVNITTNDTEGLKAIQPMINAHRAQFLTKVTLSLSVFVYEQDSQQVSFQGSAKIPLDSVSNLYHHVTWLNRKFTNIQQRQTIPVTLCVAVENQPEYQITVDMENLPSDTLQLGISIEEPLQFSFYLKDGDGHTSCSEVRPIIV